MPLSKRSMPIGIVLFGCLAGSPAIAADDAGACRTRNLSNVMTLDFPIPQPNDERGRSPATLKVVTVSRSGQMITTEARMATKPVVGRWPSVLFKPHGEASFGAVMQALRATQLTEGCPIMPAGNELFSEIFDRKTPLLSNYAVPLAPAFALVTNAVVTVKFEPPPRAPLRRRGDVRSGCHAFFNLEEVNSTALRDRGFKRLDTVVKWVGGIEAFRGTDPLEFSAIIQAESATPWKCVAGAIYNMQISGYSTADLVVL